MRVSVDTRWLQKAGNSTAEYEDAFYPGTLEAEAWYLRAAIADGATETSFSREWAHELVRAYCKRRIREARLAHALPNLQRRWSAQVGSVPLTWYAQEKLSMGAFASLLGLTIMDREATPATWRAVAIGDSCVFQLRQGDLIRAFPMQRSKDFSSRPTLISSLGSSNGDVRAMTSGTAGHWKSGDQFLLMTDALAQFFLGSLENRGNPRRWLKAFNESPDRFEDWMDKMRRTGKIRNDDVTVVTINLEQ